MGTAEDLFAGIRPSDLRFDNVHILAEYIARAQRFSDAALKIEKSAERLVQGAVRTTEEGVKQFRTAVARMRTEFEGLDGHLRRSVDVAGAEIAHAVSEAHASGAASIFQAAELTRQHAGHLANQATAVSQVAERLEKAAALAEASRQSSLDELARLRTYKLELAQFESESQARIAEARAGLYRGAGLWRRVVYVLFPPVPYVRGPKPPNPPVVPARDSKAQAATSKGNSRPAANVRTATLMSHRNSK
jgi:hypothetical protein